MSEGLSEFPRVLGDVMGKERVDRGENGVSC